MKKIMIVLALTLMSPVFAGEKEEACKHMGIIAYSAMELKREGNSKEDVILNSLISDSKVNALTKSIIDGAYLMPDSVSSETFVILTTKTCMESL